LVFELQREQHERQADQHYAPASDRVDFESKEPVDSEEMTA
jgi:hypothetical protein